MSSSTRDLDSLTGGQYQKEMLVNAEFDAASPSTVGGRRDSVTSGLTWGVYGGNIIVDGAVTHINNTTVTLTNSATNYIEMSRSGTVSVNTSGFTAGKIPLYSVVVSSSLVTSYTDYRVVPSVQGLGSYVAKAMTDANYTVSAVEARCQVLEFTGTLTAQRNIVVPLGAQQWTVFNNTTGGFGLQVIGASGTGVVIAAGKTAVVYSNGTNVKRATADV